MLKVDTQGKMAQLWASWPLHIRERLLRMAKIDTGEHGMSLRWSALQEQDRTEILRLLYKLRTLYVACNLSDNWRHVANAMQINGSVEQ